MKTKDRVCGPDSLGRMYVSQTDKDVFIVIPKDLVIFAQAERPDFPLKITDRDKMSEWMAKYLIHFGGDTESGVTEFEEFLDRMFIDAYENAEEWIEPIKETYGRVQRD